jgi:hypothetical protein
MPRQPPNKAAGLSRFSPPREPFERPMRLAGSEVRMSGKKKTYTTQVETDIQSSPEVD